MRLGSSPAASAEHTGRATQLLEPLGTSQERHGCSYPILFLFPLHRLKSKSRCIIFNLLGGGTVEKSHHLDRVLRTRIIGATWS